DPLLQAIAPRAVGGLFQSGIAEIDVDVEASLPEPPREPPDGLFVVARVRDEYVVHGFHPGLCAPPTRRRAPRRAPGAASRRRRADAAAPAPCPRSRSAPGAPGRPRCGSRPTQHPPGSKA